MQGLKATCIDKRTFSHVFFYLELIRSTVFCNMDMFKKSTHRD